ncbi:MAG: nucleotidyltransferase domain-containing protein [Candidatus Rokubacteria bacterium]|nr:nucleotidyltransferase domain-containing protein [Candidatus Rokubacteria bacterium]
MDNTSAPPAVARLVDRAKKDPDVLAVLLFGSRARGDAAPSSDFDVCLVLGAEPRSDRDRAEKRLEYLAEEDLDVAIFQALPLHIRSRVLKDGTVLYARDEEALYAVAIGTARAWEGVRHIHRQDLDEVLRG